jgi:hypothetical protein
MFHFFPFAFKSHKGFKHTLNPQEFFRVYKYLISCYLLSGTGPSLFPKYSLILRT